MCFKMGSKQQRAVTYERTEKLNRMKKADGKEEGR